MALSGGWSSCSSLRDRNKNVFCICSRHATHLEFHLAERGTAVAGPAEEFPDATMKIVTTDPVCGMEVDPQSDLSATHDGVRYLFCSAGCLRKFTADPQRYITGTAEQQTVKKREPGRASRWQNYIPLMVIVVLAMLAAQSKQWHYAVAWSGMAWMHDFMGFFLVMFSMFKFFDLEGFADGFQMYDLLAERLRGYAYIYPFLELGLGLGYLSHWQPRVIYSATVLLMVFGSLGVFRALAKGLDLECACMGTVLKVPLSTVALLEDIGMAVMAAAMLWTLT
jgi:YHS domain-containing protein